jgi:hypothetical protein
MKMSSAMISFLLPLLLATQAGAAALRVADFETAKKQALANKLDIAVLVRGSNWCQPGEQIKTYAWDTAEFGSAVEKQAVLMDVDDLEGWRRDRLREQAMKAATGISAGTHIDIKSDNPDTTFTLLPDGSFLAGGKAAAKETYSLRYKTGKTPVNLILIKVLPDPSLPGTGPGRADNGNAILSEVLAETFAANNVATPVKFTAAISDTSDPNRPPQAIDGDLNDASGWDIESHAQHIPRTIALVASPPIPPNSRVLLKLAFVSRWGKHLFGRFQVTLATNPDAAGGIMPWQALVARNYGNRNYTCYPQRHPALVLLDGEGRVVGWKEALPRQTSAKELVTMVAELEKKRQQRDQLWADAEAKSNDPTESAKLLGQSLDLLGGFGHGNAYRFVFDKIKKIDPQDTSHYLRKYEFNGWATRDRAMQLAGEKKYDEALAFIEKEWNNPANDRLSNEQKQFILLGKYFIYCAWPQQTERQWEVLRELRDFDNNTHLGIGAEGKLLMKEGPPSITHGWQPRHLKEGAQALTVDFDTKKYFTTPGLYRLTLAATRGANPLQVRRVCLLVDGKEAAADAHNATLATTANKNNAFRLVLPDGGEQKKVTIRIDCEAAAGLDNGGTVTVERLLPWE